MTDEDDDGNDGRVFAMGMTYEGRSVPPKDWGLETAPGIAGRGADLPFVQVQGGALLPSFFVMQLTVPPPNKATIRLVYTTHPDGVTVTTIYAFGMDAFQAVDVLRRIAPIDVWNRLAVRDVGFRLAMMNLNAGSDGVAVLKAMGLSEENAQILLKAFSADAGRWPAFVAGTAPEVPSDSPEWNAATSTWRESLESGGFGAAVRGTPARPNVRRNRVTDEHLAEVAAVYRNAEAAGKPPAKAVEEAFFTTYSTATRWIGLARKAGILGPAQKGKSGEVTQDDSGE